MLTFALFLLLVSPVTFVVARWAWRYQLRWLELVDPESVSTNQAQTVRITSVLVVDLSVLVAVAEPDAAAGLQASLAVTPGRVVVGQLPALGEEALLALREWSCTGVSLAMSASADRIRFKARTGAPVTLKALAA